MIGENKTSLSGRDLVVHPSFLGKGAFSIPWEGTWSFDCKEK